MLAEQVPLRDSAGDVASAGACFTGAEIVSRFRDQITRCASEFASSYDDRQDLAAEICLALLRYREDIQYPTQFVRTVARNLAINRCVYGSRAWEVAETDLRESTLDDPSVPLVEYVRSKNSAQPDPSIGVEARDTLIRLEQKLAPSEKRCYELLKQGFEQEDLPRLMGITKQAISKLMQSIRRKYLALEREEI